MRRLLACLGLAAGCALALAGAVQAVAFRSGSGLRVGPVHALDARLYALTVSSSAIPGPANVRILLPSGYAAHPHRRYPVLYLLHGTSGGAADWTKMGDAETTTAGKPLIVVMPDIGLNGDGGGWCTNWVSGAHRQWETFHIGQLVPWVDANLRTIATRGGRAVAGLSQGGFCSMSYAARHPDLFGVGLSYSGAPDIAYDAVARVGFTGVLAGIEAGLDHVAPGSIFGSPVTDEINWAGHDPTTLAPNLRHTKMYLYTGNGLPGPFDNGLNPGSDTIEGGVHVLTQFFHQRLVGLGIPSFYDDYGPGTHSWPYWARDLRESVGPMLSAMAHGIEAPRRVDFTSADSSYSVYGWKVAMHRAVQEFSTLGGAAAGGFTLAGSGSGAVTTPPLFARHARCAVTDTLGDGSVRRTVVRAGRDKRLRLSVPLGPSNTISSFPSLPGTKVFTTRVTIKPVAR
jgi:S-formylglutathione hydrolase FrmB